VPHNDHTCTACLLLLPTRGVQALPDAYKFTCPRCGEFVLTGSADAVLTARLPEEQDKIPVLGHYLRRMQRAEHRPMLGSAVVQKILETAELPSPFEQADNLLRLVAERVFAPGELTTIRNDYDLFIVGAKTEAGVRFLMRALIERGLLTGDVAQDRSAVTPTLEGWQRYDELRRGIPTGRKAFMALQFGDPDLDHLVESCFRRVVSQAGFTLFRLDDEPRAGSIDDRIRVEIQTSRFLIADLTHANNGAYWEAGYAEGLKKPVIYTCRADAFGAIHFDTSHLLTVKWTRDDLEDAGERLKATIRATLPDAKRTDD
jgi:hypothetical protein